MLERWKRKRKSEGLVALELRDSGYALAQVTRGESGAVRLQACQHAAWNASAEQQAQLAAAVSELGLRGAPCVLVLRPDRYSLRQIDAPAVDDAELVEAARWGVKELVDFDVADAVVDVIRVPQKRASRIYVVAAPIPSLKPDVERVERAGLELVAIDVAEMALRNLGSLLPESPRGVAILWLADRVGLLVFAREGTLQLTRAVDADLEGLGDAAWDDAPDRKPEDSDDLLSPLLLETQRSLDFHEHGLGFDPVSRVVIAPLETGTALVRDYLAANLVAKTGALDLNQLLDCPEPLTPAMQARCLLAVGAALRQEASAS